MKKMLLMLSVLLLLCGCASDKDFEPTPDEMLTQKEQFHLFDYARGFIHSTKAVKLTREELQVIDSIDPEIYVKYTAPKTGKMTLTWLLPAKSQFIVIAEGRLDIGKGNHAKWTFKKILYSRSGSLLPEDYGISEDPNAPLPF